MATSPASPDSNVLSSDWTGLSPHLIARFYPVRRVDAGGGRASIWERVPGSVEVRAPITDASLDGSFNWHSPFENTGADQQFSSVSALLQTGALSPLLTLFNEFLEKNAGGALSGATQGARDGLKGLEGRTSITKLNSTQVFNGMPPLKVSLTVHFRALKDARAEVERPLNQLMSWAFPQELAQDGPVLGAVKNGDVSLYPSLIPQIIGMQYADMQLLPLVIEGAPYPLGGPRDKNGTLLSAQSALQLSTLAAIDARDWASATPFRSQR